MIRTFSSRAGRLSATNKHYLNLNSSCVLSQDQKLNEISKEILLDIGFGDGMSLSEDIERA